MTFQFIVKYVDPEYDRQFYPGRTDDNYRSLDECIKSKRIRAKNSGQAIKIFQQKYPDLEIIGWR